jgi:hypothetical protein
MRREVAAEEFSRIGLVVAGDYKQVTYPREDHPSLPRLPEEMRHITVYSYALIRFYAHLLMVVDPGWKARDCSFGTKSHGISTRRW